VDAVSTPLHLEIESWEVEKTIEEELKSVNEGNGTLWEVKLKITLEEFVLFCLGTKAFDRDKKLINAVILIILNERRSK